MPVLYFLLQALTLPLVVPFGLWAFWVHKGRWAYIGQRFGFYASELRSRLDKKTERRIWIHAASIGEAHIALALIDALRQHRADLRFVLSTMTDEGWTLVERRRPEHVELVFFPLDFWWCMRRAYRLIQPDLVLLVEMELWPNHLWHARKQNIPAMLINARMPTADSARYRRFAWFFRSIFQIPALVCAQTEADAARFVRLGVAPEKIKVLGHMKYDLPPGKVTTDSPAAAAILAQLGAIPGTPVLVAGSTCAGEEEILFDLVARLRRGPLKPLLVIAPRDISRTPWILMQARRRDLIAARRSMIAPTEGALAPGADCLVLDTMGELPEFYALATVSFIGKSLTGYGGQNPIEAAANGSPVVFGPHMENFETIAQQLLADGGALQVRDSEELQETIDRLLRDPAERGRIVAAAARVIQENSGALQRTVSAVLSTLPTSTLRPLPNCLESVV